MMFFLEYMINDVIKKNREILKIKMKMKWKKSEQSL